jgi:hypothetical protein
MYRQLHVDNILYTLLLFVMKNYSLCLARFVSICLLLRIVEMVSPSHPSSLVAEHVNLLNDVMHIPSPDACASPFSISSVAI